MKNEFKEKYKNTFVTRIQSYDENRKLKCWTKFRISEQNLEIEKSWNYTIPRNDIICKLCHLMEDEKHFLLDSKIN